MKIKATLFAALSLFVLSTLIMVNPVSALVWDDPVIVKEDERPYLGVYLNSETTPDGGGAIVTAVSDNTPAERAGLREGDVILAVNGNKIDSASHLTEVIGGFNPGDDVEITYRRDGETKTVSAELATRMDVFWNEKNFRLQRGLATTLKHKPGNAFSYVAVGESRYYLGIEYRELNEDLASYFDAAAKGIVVLEVAEESPAAEAGMKAGDVILEVAGRTVMDEGDLRNVLRIREEETESLPVVITRRGERMTLTLKAEKTDRSFWHKRMPQTKEQLEKSKQFRFYGPGKDRVISLSRTKPGLEHELNGEMLIDVPGIGNIIAPEKGSANIVINSNGETFRFQFKENGTISFNDKEFDSIKEFKEFTKSEEFKNLIKNFEKKLDEPVKIRVRKHQDAV